MKPTKVTIQAVVAADKKKACDYYTQPEHITRWNFATDDWQCPSASNDMKVGGKYTARMEAKDGSFGFDFEAFYEEILPGEKFSYRMPDGREVIVKFEERSGATEVVINFDTETMNPVEMQQAGWQAILNNYKRYTEGN